MENPEIDMPWPEGLNPWQIWRSPNKQRGEAASREPTAVTKVPSPQPLPSIPQPHLEDLPGPTYTPSTVAT